MAHEIAKLKASSALVPPMTKDEARACVTEINAHVNHSRVLLLELYERRGWEALGYRNWRECVGKEFGQSQSYLYRQLAAARIEKYIAEANGVSPMGQIGQMRERTLRNLATLTPEEQKQAVENAKQYEVYNGPIVQREARKIRIRNTAMERFYALPPDKQKREIEKERAREERLFRQEEERDKFRLGIRQTEKVIRTFTGAGKDGILIAAMFGAILILIKAQKTGLSLVRGAVGALTKLGKAA